MARAESRDLPVAKVYLYRVEPPSGGDANAFAGAETSTGTVVMIPPEQADEERKSARESEKSPGAMSEIPVASKELYLSGSVTVGRKEICDLRPIESDESLDATVSRVHFIVTASKKSNGGPLVEFTDTSSNSTFINDVERVKKGETQKFSDKFFLSLGRNVYDSDLNDPPRRFRVRCELTPYGKKNR